MIKGLIAPILSPFDDNLDFNQELYNQLAKKLLETGCSGLAPFGTTGEALSVSNSERKSALEGLVKFGIDPLKLIPGTGLCNLPDTIDLCRHALGLGCKGVMTLPPFYFKGMSDDGLHDYYVKLIEGINDTNLKIYLYHIPQVSGVGLSIDLVRNLHTEFPDTIVGIKDSSGDWENTKALLGIKGLIVYPGAELPVIDAIRLGAPGCISATANLNGTDIAEVIDLCHEEKWEAAEAKHEKVRAVRLMFQDYAPIPAQKALLAKATGHSEWENLRPPMQPMATDKLAKLTDSLAKDFDMHF
ncbi:MAG: dihydrodipicolinate synthase family protein [Rhodobacteraceae bacterium]|nr:dihydrodipicolinate synthase family protein [Paracoccaceae bacterium]MBT6436407.1 dihydrodipicolinate synthase family protein [Paracoccaceae bacterium]MDG1299925.1 dihydrodipicolinate synthase family protein [Paracoccaceae bacterium]|tara:strand:+ start:1674 stop:2573 length:900 start_codon:yes stop_codon:yes gene_type:complete